MILDAPILEVKKAPVLKKSKKVFNVKEEKNTHCEKIIKCCWIVFYILEFVS